jgi:hypothetical protein
MRIFVRTALVIAAACLAFPAGAETVGTLNLDGLSFISFQDEKVVSLAGGAIAFHFGAANLDGSIPFSIGPADVSIPDIALSTGQTLRYSLASATTGRLRPSPTGQIVEFSATVIATVTGGEESGSLSYSVPFTTETVSTSSGGKSVQVTGARIAPAARYTQLVGATVNKADTEPTPGSVVYTVLSGTFDRLP